MTSWNHIPMNQNLADMIFSPIKIACDTAIVEWTSRLLQDCMQQTDFESVRNIEKLPEERYNTITLFR